jgi:hypothetical protein
MKTLPVIFRMTTDDCAFNQVTAVFPTVDEGNGNVACYAHVGQHGLCGREWYATRTRPATAKEYRPLLLELRGIYERSLSPEDEAYKLRIVRRWTRGRKAERRSYYPALGVAL